MSPIVNYAVTYQSLQRTKVISFGLSAHSSYEMDVTKLFNGDPALSWCVTNYGDQTAHCGGRETAQIMVQVNYDNDFIFRLNPSESKAFGVRESFVPCFWLEIKSGETDCEVEVVLHTK